MATTRNPRRSTADSPPYPTPNTKKISVKKQQLSKKRTALADITNQRNGPPIRVPSSLSQSKHLMPCQAKTVKIKKDSSSYKCDKGLSTTNLLLSSRGKSGTSIPPKNGPVPDVNIFDASPSRFTDGSVSLDETMSTSDAIRSPEYEYVESNVAQNITVVSENVHQGNTIKHDIPVEMELYHGFLIIDENSADPQYCQDIDCEIYEHLRRTEAKRRPSVDFMEKIQKDITAAMRTVLIDWLVEVAEEYRLVPETLYLSVNYIDRYLSGNMMNRSQLQLLGVACMMIAAKYEEITPPHADEFCCITDHTYKKNEVLDMESAVLNYLEFEITVPTAKCFLRRFVRVAQRRNRNKVLSMKFECLANYIAELSLLDYNMLRYSPSLTAAAAIFLAKFILCSSEKPWNVELVQYTFYKPYELYDCVMGLHRLYCNNFNVNVAAVREKYSQHKVNLHNAETGVSDES